MTFFGVLFNTFETVMIDKNRRVYSFRYQFMLHEIDIFWSFI